MSYDQLVLAAFENNVYAAWVDLSNEQYDIAFATSSDNGKNFQKMSIEEPNTHAWGPNIFATINAAYVTYSEWLGSEDPDWPTHGRVMLKRIVAGKTVDASVQVTSEDSGHTSDPKILAGNNSAYLFWTDGKQNKEYSDIFFVRIDVAEGKLKPGPIIQISNNGTDRAMPESSFNDVAIEQGNIATQQLHDSYWIIAFPYQYVMGVGAAIAGVVAFFVLRKRPQRLK